MSDSRTAILAALAAAQAHGGAAPGNPRPRLPASGADIDLVARWLERAAAAGASTARAGGTALAGAALADYLAVCGLPPRVVAAPELREAGIAWPPSLQMEFRAARPDDQVAVTGAFAGIAETGSIVCLGGPQHPTSLNFLCEHHVVLAAESTVLADLESLWRALAGRGGTLPRALNIITGPSRTADIEQRLQLGAHGPRRLHIIAIAPA